MTTEVTDQPYAGLLDVPKGADGKPGIITDEANYGRSDGGVAFTAPHLMVVGKTGSGKALALSTPIPTPDGFVRMGDITVGQTVFGRDGEPCTVTDVWDIIDRPELYRLTFGLADGGGERHALLADAEHQWTVLDPDDECSELVLTTAQLADLGARWKIVRHGTPRRKGRTVFNIEDIERIEPGHPDYEPARCIAVDAEDAVFLAGPGFIPTHNSRTVLAPNCARWGPRALVVMSSKGDLSELTIAKRAQYGTQYVMDLSGEIRDGQIEGVPLTPVRIDPCAWIETDDEAMEMASLLMQIGDVGAGGDGQGSGDSAFWKSLARRRLACLLRAGGFYCDPDTRQMVWGGGIAWALEASENVGPGAAEGSGRGLTQEGLDDESDEDGPDEPIDMSTPTWKTAYMRAYSVNSRHADSLMAARAMDERQRDSIGINMQVAMGSWAMDSTAAPDAKVFNPSMLATGGTLHIVAGMDGAAPTVVSTVLIEIVKYWRKRVGTLQPVLFVLDEFVNGAQVPARYLNRWISEGRSLGIRLCLGLQSTKQLTRLWGQAAADELRAIMPAALILPGAGETQMLKDAAETTPPEERVVTSLDAGGKASQSRQMMQPTHAELLPPPRNRTDPRTSYGRLLLGGQAGVRVRLLDITGTDLA